MSEIFKLDENEEEEDDTEDLQTPVMARRSPRMSSVSIASSTVMLGTIPEDVLNVWSQLPERIRLNPSMASYRTEYEKTHPSLSYSQSEVAAMILETPGKTGGECYVLNMSLKLKGKLAEKEENFTSDKPTEMRLPCIARYIKLTLLVCCWLVFFFILVSTREKEEKFHQISVPSYKVKTFVLASDLSTDRISVTVEGSFLSIIDVSSSSDFSLPYNNLSVWLELMPEKYSDNHLRKAKTVQNISDVWDVPVLPELAEIFPNQRQTKTFKLKYFPEKLAHRKIAIKFKSNSDITVPLSISYDLSPIDTEDGIALGAFVLVALYVLIIFEVIHRTIAAVLAATSAVAILAALNEKPTASEITSWIDVDTLLLLFSMMIIVAVVADTGVFDYLAVFAYKITSGKIWPLVSTLCFIASFLSIFLDNVTTVMLMTPVTIRLCEVVQLNPVPVLTAMVIFSNIGGAMTPVGDPPNVIIASNKHVIAAGVGFTTFTLHMSIGVILVLAVVYAHFRFIFRNLDKLRFTEPQDVQELRHEIAIWQKAAASLSSYSKDESVVRETLMKKVQRLLKQLKNKLANGTDTLESYQTTLDELQAKYPIKNKWLLAKSGCCMVLVIGLLFLHSWPHYNLTMGWTTFLCVLLLLILSDREDLDGLMARVEWSTLLFFAALFVLMEALAQLGLISWIGKQTEWIIMHVNEESRLAVAILLLLWVSSIASAFVDNVPLATMMIRIATGLAENRKLQLPLQPLVWALAFGACLGANGTLIGGICNAICAGIADQHGYRFTFMQFFKMGFPVLLSSTLTITIYLMVAHVIFEWNY